MKYSNTLIFILFSIFISISCNTEIHRNGTVVFFTESNGGLYLVYHDNGENHILSADLEPLDTRWEKSISGDSEAPVIKIFDNYIACNCEKEKVCLLSADNGNTELSFESELIFTSGVKGFTVNGSKVYSICNESEICAFDIESEELLWTHELNKNELITADFKVEGGFLLFGNSDNVIKALSTKTGEVKWESIELSGLADAYSFPETVLADYDLLNGFELATGTAKWLTHYEGKVRCILDGTVIAQSEDSFSTLYIENGQKIWEYPRNGTTILTCEEDLNLAAFTVKNYNDALQSDAEYFDKIYIFNVSSGEKVFESNSSLEYTVLNLTGFTETNFYIASKNNENTTEIVVENFASDTFKFEKSFIFEVEDPSEEIYVSWIHTDASFTVLRRSSISNPLDETYYLFETDTAEFIGEMNGIPEVITSSKAYDIISYDDYFNVIEKTLDDFID